MATDAKIVSLHPGQSARGADPTDEQFRLLVSVVADYAIYLIDPAGRVMSWNAGAERIKGYRADEIVGRDFSQFYSTEDRAAGRPQQALGHAAASGHFHGEGWRLRKDGSRFWAEVAISALRDEAGVLTGFAKVTRDMTERHLQREAQKALAESERRFRLLVQGVTDYAIYMLTPQGEIASWNAGAERIKGYAAAEVLGRHFSMFFTSEDRADGKPERALETARSSGRFSDDGWRLRKDGSRFWAAVVLDAVHDEDGRLIGFAKITRDLTERRAAEEQLREREARLQAFTSHSPAAMFLKHADGRYSFVNQRFLERYAVRHDEVIGRTDAELFPATQARALAKNDADVIARGEPVQYEEATRHGGAERVSLVVKFPVFGAAGRVIGVGGVASDITDLKITEQALREQRMLLAEAQKVAGLSSWEWTPESGRLTWSDELYRIYGVAPEGFTPSFESYLERVHPEDRQNSGAMMARALMDGRGFTMHERIVRPGGEVRYLRSHGAVVRGPTGKPVKILGACLDITEHRHSEAALRQAAQDLHALTRRLVQAEEGERRRIARELHDRVGQSLSALNINLDIVLGRIDAPAEVRHRLEDSAALVERTLESIEGVMAELRPPLLDEYGLAAALGWYAEDFARRTGIATAVADAAGEAEAKLRPEAATALFRIAQEALNNVLKHAHARSVGIEVSAAKDSVVLAVRDDGRGFEPAAAPRGRWGMTTMRERAEAAGGYFEVQSTPGQGTVVRVRVPR